MSKAAFDAKMAAVDSLRSIAPDSARDAALVKALRDRSNVIVAKAARVAADVGASAANPDLLAAFDRMMTNSVKNDPQCLAKLAIVKALATLGHEEPEIYVRGLRHVQMEPVWGGQEDTAGALRANCGSALLNCRGLSDLDALEYLIELLVDRDKTVRAEAARAIGRIERREAALLLRLRALSGDAEPEVLGAVFSALLSVEGKRGIPFVARFLDGGEEAAQEAALALGEAHDPDAYELLRASLQRRPDSDMRSTLMMAIALTRLPEAIDFLIGEAGNGSRDAKQALERIPIPEEQRLRLQRVGV